MLGLQFQLLLTPELTEEVCHTAATPSDPVGRNTSH